MSSLLSLAILATLGCYALALALILLRLFIGPSAQDRVMALDGLYLVAVPLLLVLAIRYGSQMYFEAALLIALSGFVSTLAMGKFLLRGEVIE